jgi:hypothetical protein
MSVINDFQVSGLFPSTVGGTGTAIKYFPRVLGPSIGVAPLTPSASSAAGQLVVPGNNELNGQTFKVKVTGDVLNFTGGTTYNVVLYANTGTIGTPNYIALASTGAVGAANVAKASFNLDVTIFGSTGAGNVGGYYNSVTLTPAGVQTSKAQAALDTALTGINFNAAATPQGNANPFGLVVGITFATSIAQNSANLYQFQIIAD